MKNVLLLASVASMIQQFNMRNIELLLKMGYKVEVACNFEQGNTCAREQIENLKKELENKNVVWHQIDFARNVFCVRQNFRAYQQLHRLFRHNTYAFVHCHSPIGGVLGRITAHKYKTKVIYTAHGFHFFKGAPFKNWMLFYPVEKLLSYYTDELLVINREDYELAGKKFHMKHLTYLPGIGVNIDVSDNSEEEKHKKREELNIPVDAFMIIQVAEFTPNKNQQTVIKAIEEMANPEVFYVMCGIGPEKEALEKYVKEQKLNQNIRFAGFRSDIHELLQCADCFTLSSYREGLSVALMEAMAEGLPVVCSRIRGNVDLIEDGLGGYLVEPGNCRNYEDAYKKMFAMWKGRQGQFATMGNCNRQKIKQFSAEAVDEIMRKVYGNKTDNIRNHGNL